MLLQYRVQYRVRCYIDKQAALCGAINEGQLMSVQVMRSWCAKLLSICKPDRATATMLYGNAGFDMFAARISSPLFNRLCASTRLAVATDDAAVVGPISTQSSSASSEAAIHFNMNSNRRLRCNRRVIFSSSSPCESPCESQERLLDQSAWDDACYICGEQEGEMLCCEGDENCTTVSHQLCLG